MKPQERTINRVLIIGWSAIIATLILSYLGEALKTELAWSYLVAFILLTTIPILITIILYRKNPASHHIRYYIVSGYLFMYLFVMLTGRTILIFTYILPMLFLIILYHDKHLVLITAIVALIINMISITIKIIHHDITLHNSKDVEIQLILLIISFAASYVASRIYGQIIHSNITYLEMLNETSKQIQKMTFQSITTIANTIDAKDEYTKGHSQRVSEYSYALAKELGLSEEECDNIRNIALLHDIGKIGVPDSILNKPGKLTQEEFRIMKEHPIVGSDILDDIRILPELDIGAKYHHERYDGKGYPNGLSGESIPLIARIICVTDAYDAMSSNRVYRKGFSDDWILEEIERCKGTQFDPNIADTFIRLLKKNKLQRLSSNESIHWENIPEYSSTHPANGKKKDILDELADLERIKAVELKIAQELKNHEGCLLLIDVDNIDEINNNQGYLRGDYCLGLIAQMLLKPTRNLMVSRLEGDEFLCFLPAINTIEEAEKEVLTLMNDLNTDISQIKELEGITLSAGASLSIISGKKYAQMFMDADKALYHIKKQHKNGFFIYSDKPKNEYNCTNEHDLHQLVELLKKEDDYSTYNPTDLQEFNKIYDFIHEVKTKKAENIQLVLYTIKSKDPKTFSMEERLNTMQYLENAITCSIREQDNTTRYSRTQQLVIFTDLTDAEIEKITNQITKIFYRMYDKKDVVLTYDIANLNISISNKD